MTIFVVILRAQASYSDVGSLNHNLLKILFVVNFFLVIMFVITENIFSLFILFEMSIIPISLSF